MQVEELKNDQQKTNRFTILNGINVSDHIEKKNNLSYLSWAWAWQEFKKLFPDSIYKIYENADGFPYFSDGKTCWVKTGVTLIDGDYSLEHIEYLPIMDFKNASIPKERVTSMDVNKAVQRSLTKAIARHGMGLYIYAGEDLPEESEEIKAARIAEEAAVKKELENIRSSINDEVKRVTSNFTNDQKIDFAKKKIIPIIGQSNYMTCDDMCKLSKLLKELKKA